MLFNTETIAYADPVLLTITHLRSGLAARSISTPVHNEVPNPRPAEFVRVLRTGGPKDNDLPVVENSQLTIECWSDDQPSAATLARTVRALVNAMAGVTVSGVTCYRDDEFSGPADLPDPVSDQHRMTWTASVRFRCARL